MKFEEERPFPKPLRDRPMDETAAPYTLATWEYPPCVSCAGECVFTDGLCQPCWIAYTERTDAR